MVQFIYEKYNTTVSYGLGNGEYVGTFSGGSLTGASDYYLNSSGAIILTGNTTVYNQGQSVYAQVGSGILVIRTLQGNGQYTQYNYPVVANYVKGTLADTPIAEDGTYPDDGISEGYWYVKKYIADGPILIKPNGGEVISGVYTVEWSLGEGGVTHDVEYSTDNGQSWTLLVAQTTVNAQSYTRDFRTLTPSNVAKIRVRSKMTVSGTTYYSQYDESAGVFTVRDNAPPLAPTLISPVGTKVNALNITRFLWQHNDTDTQSKADIRVREQGATTWDLAEIFTVIGSQQEVYGQLDAGLAPVNMEWQVRTYDQQNQVSPWSNIGVFEFLNPTAEPVITAPITTVTDSRPVIQWTSPGQVSYQITITDTDNVVLWDTGEVNSTLKSRTSGIDFINGATYRINVRSKDGSGVFSNYAQVQVVTSYTTPMKPIGTIGASVNNNGIDITFTNPTPQGGAPAVVKNEIYKYVDDRWLLIKSGVFAGFTDYAVASGQSYAYKVRGIASNTAYAESSILWGKVDLAHTELAIATNLSDNIVLKEMKGIAKQKSRNRSLNQFEGRPFPLAEFGGSKALQLSCEWINFDKAEINAFYDLIDQEKTLLYRDPQGRKEYVTVDVTSETEDDTGTLFRITFTADRVWFKEGVV